MARPGLLISQRASSERMLPDVSTRIRELRDYFIRIEGPFESQRDL
jgi:hypothetical protein